MKILRYKKDAVAKDHLLENVEMTIENVKMFFNPEGTKEQESFKILKVGGLYEGVAQNHETGETYNCVGFLVESQHLFADLMEKPEQGVGFFSIWKATKKSYDPFIFYDGDTSFNLSRYGNGCGDFIEIRRELISATDVEQVMQSSLKTEKGDSK